MGVARNLGLEKMVSYAYPSLHRCSEANANAIRIKDVLGILPLLGTASEEKLFHQYLVKNT